MHTVYLSLGSNLGDKKGNIRRALSLVEAKVGRVSRRSAVFVTKPWGFRSEHMFVNAAARVCTMLTPRGVLEATQAIERDMGRTLKSADGHYHDRTIDIDILLFDDVWIDEADLRIPHPLMLERDFVMRPLREVLDDAGLKIVEQLRKREIQPTWE